MKTEFKFNERQFDLIKLGIIINAVTVSLLSVVIGIKIVLKQEFYVASVFWFVPINNFYSTFLFYMIFYLLSLIIYTIGLKNSQLNNHGGKKQ
jgi:hypothetical protein